MIVVEHLGRLVTEEVYKTFYIGRKIIADVSPCPECSRAFTAGLRFCWSHKKRDYLGDRYA